MVAVAARGVRASRLAEAWSAWRGSVVTALALVAAFRAVTLLLVTVVERGTFQRDWSGFDFSWWASIAEHGYGYSHPGAYSDAAFAPAYPGVMRVAMGVLQIGPLAAGFLVSSISLLVAATVIHRLIAEDHGDTAAGIGVLLLLLWPSAVFLAAPYSEPFSLALVALALLAARRERWWWAGTLAALAMLSKYVLGVLVIALVINYVVRRRRGGRDGAGALVAVVLPGALAFAGLLLFMRAQFGDPLFFLAAEAHGWGHQLATPVQLVINLPDDVSRMIRAGNLWSARTAVLDAATVLGLAALAVFALRRRREHPAETALLALVALAFLCMSAVDSVGRYSLTVAPVFILLGPALARRPRLRTPVLAGSAALMVVQLATFTTWGWAG